MGIVLTNKLPGITISQILYSQKKDKTYMLEIHGVSKDRMTLLDFKSKIEVSPSVLSSDLPISNFIEKNNLNFTIYLVMK